MPKRVLLRKTCLKPTYNLRTQLFVSFGSTAVISIIVVTIIAITTAKRSGTVIKQNARGTLENQISQNLRSSAYIADTVTRRFESLAGVASILEEASKDRIVGYPNLQDVQSDRFVPFLDYEASATNGGAPRNIYPLRSTKPVPFDWEIDANVNSSNYQQHVQGRYQWYNGKISTVHPSILIQGQCDPSSSKSSNEDSDSSWTYYPNCTEANNNRSTGGIVQPTPLAPYLMEKAAELAIFMKPLYESSEDIKTTGVYFANQGAGLSVSFPGSLRDGTSTFTSIGCDWMETTNPLTGEPLGTAEDIQRCHAKGATVNAREYNPLERAWCRDQALHPNTIQMAGPYPDAFQKDWLLTMGRAIFDRHTGVFTGCTLVDISMSPIYKFIQNLNIGNYSDISLVRWDTQGTIIVSSQWDPTTSTTNSYVHDLDLGIDQVKWDELRHLIDFENQNDPWTPQQIQSVFGERIYESAKGKLFSIFPMPVPPTEYTPTYKPDAFVILSVEPDIFDVVDETFASVDDDVLGLIIKSLVIGICGIIVVLLFIWLISKVLTTPLLWLNEISKRIMNNEDVIEAWEDDSDVSQFLNACTPNTEISRLVSEFRFMIHGGFSASGSSRVATPAKVELKNYLGWYNEFNHFYDLEQNNAMKKKKQIENENGTYTTNDDDDDDEEEELNGYHDGEGNGYSGKPTRDAKGKREQGGAGSVHAPRIRKALRNEAKQRRNSSNSSHSDEYLIHRVNKGRNTQVITVGNSLELQQQQLVTVHNSTKPVLTSRLFWWIIGVIVVPLLATMAAIGTLVTLEITNELPSWLEILETESVALERNAILTATTARASFAEASMLEPIRDLHLLTRAAGWLLFGAFGRSEGFTYMKTVTEACKTTPRGQVCPVYEDKSLAPCDCAWKDSFDQACGVYPSIGPENSRPLQVRSYAGQAHDADPITGDRLNALGYPNIDYSPNTTAWWSNFDEMPGSYKGSSASGYETTYDRVRVSSALAAIEFPIYNYPRGSKSQKHIGTFIAMEADGMLMGWSGCSYTFAGFANFQSNDRNGGYKFNPDVCPKGKHGYDARCRGWYAKGKEKGLSPEGSATLITSPYLFQSVNTLVATSATSALVDPITGKYVGQALLDFFPDGIITTLENDSIVQRKDAFPILITSEEETLGGNVIVGPGYSVKSGNSSPSLVDLLFDHDDADDHDNAEYKDSFRNMILQGMQSGDTTDGTFTRITSKGEEKVYIAYAPVKVRQLRPIFPSEFSQGVNTFDTQIFSVAFAIPEENLYDFFAPLRADVQDDIDSISVIVISLIVVVAAVVTFIAYHITVEVTSPVIVLLSIVENINQGLLTDDIPPMKGGSREVNGVYISFAKLHKVMTFSNTAFFGGQLAQAYELNSGALALFRKINDKKAIGIACNNLGNTLLAMIREHDNSRECCAFGDERKCVWTLAKQCFDETVDFARKDWSKQTDWLRGNKISSIDFGERLTDRYLNRGLFYLLTMNDPCAPAEAKELGYKDIARAKELDTEIKRLRRMRSRDKMNSKSCVINFENALRRISGMVEVLKEKGIEDTWGVRDTIDEAENELFAAWNRPSHPLFEDMNQIARLQQLESAVIKFELATRNYNEGVRIALRMLVEDQYLLEESFVVAANALLSESGSQGGFNNASSTEVERRQSALNWEPGSVAKIKFDLRKTFKNCKSMAVPNKSNGKALFLCVGDSSIDDANRTCRRANEGLLTIYDKSGAEGDVCGFVRCTNELESVESSSPSAVGGASPFFFLGQKLGGNGGTTIDGFPRSILVEAVQGSNKGGRNVSSKSDCVFATLTHIFQQFTENESSNEDDESTVDNISNDRTAKFSPKKYDSVWVVCVASCEEPEADTDGALFLLSKLNRIKEENNSNTNVIIIGANISEEQASTYEDVCAVLNRFTFINASDKNDDDEMESVFDDVTKLISAGCNKGGKPISRAVTMEKF